MKIPRRPTRVEIPVVAMGDLAFILLVFLLILARSQDDSNLLWEPSKVEQVQKIEQGRASVALDRENRLYLNSGEISVGQLAGELEKILGNAPAGKRTVTLKVHKDIQAGRFEPVLEAISQAGGEIAHVVEVEK